MKGSLLSTTLRRLALPAILLTFLPAWLGAQDDAVRDPADTVTVADSSMQNGTAGEFTPAKGFDIFKSDRGSLNISFYGLFRYVNHMPGRQTFTDHLGRERDVKPRNDLNWHRTMVWLTGFFYDPRFRYNITLWSLPTTQQTLLFGNLQYRFHPAISMGVGIAPSQTARSMGGSWPFWASSDRQMAEEFFRGGFSSGVWITGQPVKTLYYNLSLTNNISQLGTTAANDSRELMYSGSVWWMPTTNEFGPRGGLEDFEHHRRVATRFGVSGGRGREGRYANDEVPPNATQIKLSDGVNPFDEGALAEGVTVRALTYEEIAFDAGFKYRGASLQGEAYFRRLSDFATADLPLPEWAAHDLDDRGFQVQASYMVVPRKANLHLTYGYVDDEFERKPWELSGGISVYPSGTRSWRLNLHVNRVERSPTASSFGFYVAGQSGTTVSLGTDILL
ncbi:MAG TPA: hypothetical protein VEQ60_11320 [Longimicrobium sp.]|nr:hypothetical protein [Longimicrobium sp.]